MYVCRSRILEKVVRLAGILLTQQPCSALLLTQRPPFSFDHHLYSDKNHPHFFQVLVTNLDVESVTHLEPANFWIGPSAVSALLSPSALQDKCLGLSWRIR